MEPAVPNDVGAIVERVLDPDGPAFSREQRDALYAIGRVYYEREDFARGADVFRLLVLAAPLEARSWLSLAACHQGMGDTERAAQLYHLGAEAPEGPRERAMSALQAASLAMAEGRGDDARELLELVDEDALDEELARSCRVLRAHVGKGVR